MKPINRITIVVICLFGVATARCGAQPRPAPSPAGASSTRPAKAALSLDDIEPPVALPKAQPLHDEPPLEALHFYAQARIAWMERDRKAAIALLEQAATIDPDSYYLHSTLGRMYRTPGAEFTEQSIDMLEKAAALEPDHLDIQMDLGRQLEAKGDMAGAIKRLRLALLTHDYSLHPGSAAVTEFFLGNLLRKEGYDQASLELYQRLSAHLRSPEVAAEPSREVSLLLNQADVIDMEIAEMLARRGMFPEAVAAFAGQIERNPGAFDLRTRHVHLLLALKRNDDAMTAAQNAVVHFRATRESIALLDETCAATGHPDGAAAALAILHKDHPADHPILYALADTLRAEKKGADAERVLAEAAATDPGDFGMLYRRFELAMEERAFRSAASLLIEAHAKRPELTTLITPLWTRLSAPTKPGRFRYPDLAALDVPKSQEAAKWFWVSRMASAAHRDDISRTALDRAVKIQPAFAPAFRDSLDDLFSKIDLDTDGKDAELKKLLAALPEAVNAALKNELQAIWHSRIGESRDAAKYFDDAVAAGGQSIDLLLERAQALRTAGEDDAADSLFWKLISDHPETSEAYQDLCLSCWRRHLDKEADHVLTVWLAADPNDVMAWRLQSIAYQRASRDQAAESILKRVLDERGDQPEVIAALEAFYAVHEPGGPLIEAFEALHTRFPANYAISSTLAEALAGDKRLADAMKIIDGMHGAYADDPDLLYSLSGLYARIGQRPASEKVLAELLKLDPRYPAAANDLGYMWTEDGRNLAEAQALIGQAVEAEPHNVSFLDSMGWVLYKRGNFAEARKYLDRAIGKAPSRQYSRADPTVLDHRGDALYRLGDKDAAAADWKVAADRLAALKDEANAEMKDLREKLVEKIRRLKAGEEVEVAPVVSP